MAADLPPLLVHVFPTFAIGGAQVRFAALANRFGDRWRHAVVSLDGRTDCAERIGGHVPLTLLTAPVAKGEGPWRLWKIRRALIRLRPYALVTSNWGSTDWVAAARTIPGLRHIHTEDGFGPDEATGQKPRRVLFRRLMLRGSEVVLPSRTLLDHARKLWRLPERRLHYIPNGLDLVRFSPTGARAALELAGEGPVIGTVGRLRPEKNVGRLLRACARIDGPWRLVIVGDGPEQGTLERLATELGIAARVRFAGHMPDPAALYRALDVFALSSDTEQMPFSVLEAMASGLSVASTDVGDVRAMLGAGQGDFVVAKDEAALAGALAGLLADPALRARLGAANRAKAQAEYDAERMFAAYAEVIRG